MPGPADMPLALDDIRVLDLAGEPGMYCGKLLAELGADVVKIEPPGGDPARRIGPFFHDEVDPDKSLYFFGLNSSKRSITLDVATTDGRALFKRLLPKADVLVETFAPGYLESIGLGYDTLSQIKPDIIHCSISGFGRWGPHSHYQAPDIVATAMSGMMHLAGFPAEAPDRPYGNQTYYCASIQATTGILMALLHRDVTGEGQQVEVSMQEALLLNQETAVPYWDIRKDLRGRVGNERRLPAIGVYECQNGYVMFMVGVPGFGSPWSELMRWMADEGKAEDLLEERWKNLFGQLDMRLIAELYFGTDTELVETWVPRLSHIDDVLARFIKNYRKEHLYEEGQRRGLLVAPVNTPQDLVENPQLNHRRWFTPVEHPELETTITYPGPPYRLDATPWRIRSRPPRVGEHNREVYCGELGLSQEQLAAFTDAGIT
jgi:benzylsuccinate CoA-transferase BbsE subunit